MDVEDQEKKSLDDSDKTENALKTNDGKPFLFDEVVYFNTENCIISSCSNHASSTCRYSKFLLFSVRPEWIPIIQKHTRVQVNFDQDVSICGRHFNFAEPTAENLIPTLFGEETLKENAGVPYKAQKWCCVKKCHNACDAYSRKTMSTRLGEQYHPLSQIADDLVGRKLMTALMEEIDVNGIEDHTSFICELHVKVLHIDSNVMTDQDPNKPSSKYSLIYYHAMTDQDPNKPSSKYSLIYYHAMTDQDPNKPSSKYSLIYYHAMTNQDPNKPSSKYSLIYYHAMTNQDPNKPSRTDDLMFRTSKYNIKLGCNIDKTDGTCCIIPHCTFSDKNATIIVNNKKWRPHLYQFPKLFSSPLERIVWLRLVRNAMPEEQKRFCPATSSKICGLHFPDGMPTRSNPNPTRLEESPIKSITVNGQTIALPSKGSCDPPDKKEKIDPTPDQKVTPPSKESDDLAEESKDNHSSTASDAWKESVKKNVKVIGKKEDSQKKRKRSKKHSTSDIESDEDLDNRLLQCQQLMDEESEYDTDSSSDSDESGEEYEEFFDNSMESLGKRLKKRLRSKEWREAKETVDELIQMFRKPLAGEQPMVITVDTHGTERNVMKESKMRALEHIKLHYLEEKDAQQLDIMLKQFTIIKDMKVEELSDESSIESDQEEEASQKEQSALLCLTKRFVYYLKSLEWMRADKTLNRITLLFFEAMLMAENLTKNYSQSVSRRQSFKRAESKAVESVRKQMEPNEQRLLNEMLRQCGRFSAISKTVTSVVQPKVQGQLVVKSATSVLVNTKIQPKVQGQLVVKSPQKNILPTTTDSTTQHSQIMAEVKTLESELVLAASKAESKTVGDLLKKIGMRLIALEKKISLKQVETDYDGIPGTDVKQNALQYLKNHGILCKVKAQKVTNTSPPAVSLPTPKLLPTTFTTISTAVLSTSASTVISTPTKRPAIITVSPHHTRQTSLMHDALKAIKTPKEIYQHNAPYVNETVITDSPVASSNYSSKPTVKRKIYSHKSEVDTNGMQTVYVHFKIEPPKKRKRKRKFETEDVTHITQTPTSNQETVQGNQPVSKKSETKLPNSKEERVQCNQPVSKEQEIEDNSTSETQIPTSKEERVQCNQPVSKEQEIEDNSTSETQIPTSKEETVQCNQTVSKKPELEDSMSETKLLDSDQERVQFNQPVSKEQEVEDNSTSETQIPTSKQETVQCNQPVSKEQEVENNTSKTKITSNQEPSGEQSSQIIEEEKEVSEDMVTVPPETEMSTTDTISKSPAIKCDDKISTDKIKTEDKNNSGCDSQQTAQISEVNQESTTPTTPPPRSERMETDSECAMIIDDNSQNILKDDNTMTNSKEEDKTESVDQKQIMKDKLENDIPKPVGSVEHMSGINEDHQYHKKIENDSEQNNFNNIVDGNILNSETGVSLKQRDSVAVVTTIAKRGNGKDGDDKKLETILDATTGLLVKQLKHASDLNSDDIQYVVAFDATDFKKWSLIENNENKEDVEGDSEISSFKMLTSAVKGQIEYDLPSLVYQPKITPQYLFYQKYQDHFPPMQKSDIFSGIADFYPGSTASVIAPLKRIPVFSFYNEFRPWLLFPFGRALRKLLLCTPVVHNRDKTGTQEQDMADLTDAEKHVHELATILAKWEKVNDVNAYSNAIRIVVNDLLKTSKKGTFWNKFVENFLEALEKELPTIIAQCEEEIKKEILTSKKPEVVTVTTSQMNPLPPPLKHGPSMQNKSIVVNLPVLTSGTNPPATTTMPTLKPRITVQVKQRQVATAPPGLVGPFRPILSKGQVQTQQKGNIVGLKLSNSNIILIPQSSQNKTRYVVKNSQLTTMQPKLQIQMPKPIISNTATNRTTHYIVKNSPSTTMPPKLQIGIPKPIIGNVATNQTTSSSVVIQPQVPQIQTKPSQLMVPVTGPFPYVMVISEAASSNTTPAKVSTVSSLTTASQSTDVIKSNLPISSTVPLIVKDVNTVINDDEGSTLYQPDKLSSICERVLNKVDNEEKNTKYESTQDEEPDEGSGSSGSSPKGEPSKENDISGSEDATQKQCDAKSIDKPINTNRSTQLETDVVPTCMSQVISSIAQHISTSSSISKATPCCRDNVYKSSNNLQDRTEFIPNTRIPRNGSLHLEYHKIWNRKFCRFEDVGVHKYEQKCKRHPKVSSLTSRIYNGINPKRKNIHDHLPEQLNSSIVNSKTDDDVSDEKTSLGKILQNGKQHDEVGAIKNEDELTSPNNDNEAIKCDPSLIMQEVIQQHVVGKDFHNTPEKDNVESNQHRITDMDCTNASEKLVDKVGNVQSDRCQTDIDCTEVNTSDILVEKVGNVDSDRSQTDMDSKVNTSEKIVEKVGNVQRDQSQNTDMDCTEVNTSDIPVEKVGNVQSDRSQTDMDSKVNTSEKLVEKVDNVESDKCQNTDMDSKVNISDKPVEKVGNVKSGQSKTDMDCIKVNTSEILVEKVDDVERDQNTGMDCTKINTSEKPVEKAENVKSNECQTDMDCSKTTARDDESENHTKTHHVSYSKSKHVKMLGNKQCACNTLLMYVCRRCSEIFLCFEDFKSHAIIHLSSKKLPQINCTKCPLTFSSMKAYECHQDSHEDFKWNRCSWCGMMFNKMENFEQHLLVHFDSNHEQIYECKCSRLFLGMKSLQMHREEHFSKKFYQCNHCPRIFHFLNNIKKHTEDVHQPFNRWKNAYWKCHLCRKDCFVASIFQLNIHMEEHNPKNEFDCQYCFETFQYLTDYLLHCMSNCRRRIALFYDCPICNLRCGVEMKAHLEGHFKGLYKCHSCIQVFSTAAAFKSHLNQKHLPIKSQNNDNSIINYKTIHHEIADDTDLHGKFCGMCGTEFSNSTNLFCNLCSEDYHDCPFNCGYKFSNQRDLTSHFLTSHQDKNMLKTNLIACPQCDTAVRNPGTMALHWIKHCPRNKVISEEIDSGNNSSLMLDMLETFPDKHQRKFHKKLRKKKRKRVECDDDVIYPKVKKKKKHKKSKKRKHAHKLPMKPIRQVFPKMSRIPPPPPCKREDLEIKFVKEKESVPNSEIPGKRIRKKRIYEDMIAIPRSVVQPKSNKKCTNQHKEMSETDSKRPRRTSRVSKPKEFPDFEEDVDKVLHVSKVINSKKVATSTKPKVNINNKLEKMMINSNKRSWHSTDEDTESDSDEFDYHQVSSPVKERVRPSNLRQRINSGHKWDLFHVDTIISTIDKLKHRLDKTSRSKCSAVKKKLMKNGKFLEKKFLQMKERKRHRKRKTLSIPQVVALDHCYLGLPKVISKKKKGPVYAAPLDHDYVIGPRMAPSLEKDVEKKENIQIKEEINISTEKLKKSPIKEHRLSPLKLPRINYSPKKGAPTLKSEDISADESDFDDVVKALLEIGCSIPSDVDKDAMNGSNLDLVDFLADMVSMDEHDNNEGKVEDNLLNVDLSIQDSAILDGLSDFENTASQEQIDWTSAGNIQPGLATISNSEDQLFPVSINNDILSQRQCQDMKTSLDLQHFSDIQEEAFLSKLLPKDVEQVLDIIADKMSHNIGEMTEKVTDINSEFMLKNNLSSDLINHSNVDDIQCDQSAVYTAKDASGTPELLFQNNNPDKGSIFTENMNTEVISAIDDDNLHTGVKYEPNEQISKCNITKLDFTESKQIVPEQTTVQNCLNIQPIETFQNHIETFSNEQDGPDANIQSVCLDTTTTVFPTEIEDATSTKTSSHHLSTNLD
ncbi:uncharacterized protein [Antedon mediterranea]|uniref:uncharacterized protein n=1 Tax=Antedon mediterranea TaxID=105859 RepID=UPI003AF8015B